MVWSGGKSDTKRLLPHDSDNSLPRYDTPGDSSEHGLEETQSPQDPSTSSDLKLNYMKTAATVWAFVGIGLTAGSFAPAIVNLQILMNTDIQALGLAVVPAYLARCLGSLLGGAAVDKINVELFLGTAVLILAASSSLYPWVPNVYVFAALHTVRYASSSALNAGCQAYILKLWHGSQNKDRLFQGLQAAWSVGCVTAPFIVAPFLVSIPSVPHVSLNLSNAPNMNVTTTVGNASSNIEPPDVERVRYAFMLIGSLLFLACPVFYAAFFIQGPFCLLQKSEHRSQRQGDVTRTEDTRYKAILLFSFFLSFVIYVPIETLPGSYLPAMAVNSLGWEVRRAALLAGVFWGSTCLGRFLTVFLSTKYSGVQIVFPALVSAAVSFLLLSLFAHHKMVVWILSGMCGLTTSAIYGSTALMASDFIVMSGLSNSVFLVGTSCGSLISYPLGGYLFKTDTYMWVAYIGFLAAITEILLLAGIKLLASFLQQGIVTQQGATQGTN